MLVLLLSAVLSATPPQFEARGGGAPVAGTLRELSAGGVVLDTSEGPKLLAASQIDRVEARQPPAAPAIKAAAWIELTDGSQLVAEGYTAKDRTAAVRIGPDLEVSVPLAAVAHVRFAEFTGPAAEQWQAILSASHEGDTLVVHSNKSLDFLDGIIGDATAQGIRFTLSGEEHDVSLSKVAGLIYARRAQGNLPAHFSSVVDAGGSLLRVADAAVAGELLKITTPSGLKLELPLARVAAVEFRTQYLSDLAAESISVTPYIGDFASLSSAAKAYYQPRFNAPEGPPLRLGGKTYTKGIAFCGQSEVAYRLPGEYRTLRALAGIDDAVRPLGDVRLSIVGDEKTLYEAELSGRDKPVELNVDLAGVRRLRIRVEFNGDEVGDFVNLCDPRIIP